MQIKRDKRRNCKSMVEGRINTYMEQRSDSEDEENFSDNAHEKKKREFIDAHYLNRRKSCQCTCCGGFDSNTIKKMDKASMDQIKLGLSHLLNAKIIRQH